MLIWARGAEGLRKAVAKDERSIRGSLEIHHYILTTGTEEESSQEN